MNRRTAEILRQHEREDKLLLRQGMRELMEQEYANSEQIIGLVQEGTFLPFPHGSLEQMIGYLWEHVPRQSPSVSAFIPVRKTLDFHIRKHTCCQTPYYHAHDFYEMIYVVRGKSGQSWFDVQELDGLLAEAADSMGSRPGNGESIAEAVCRKLCKTGAAAETGGRFYLQEGQLCLLPPGVVHSMDACSEKDLILKIVVPVSLFQDTLSALDRRWVDKLWGTGGGDTVNKRAVRILKPDPYDFEQLLFGILEETFYHREYQEDALRSYLSLLLLQILRRPLSVKDYELWNRLHSYLEQHVREARLQEFAGLCGYSAGHVGRLLKEHMGSSFGELVKQFRLERAVRYLEETDLSVEEIAGMLGYQNASGLYKQFGNWYGTTPGEIRKKRVL